MDWQAIENAFNRALEMDAASRTSFLECNFHPDPQVRSKVVQLVAAHFNAHTFWEQNENEKALIPEPVMPTTIGEYQLEKEIGHGGMGRVFLASRTKHGVTQQVAIKVLRKEAESIGLTKRFLNEFRILSTLNHPGIVQLHDYGNEQGWFYFIMELVNGVPITDYCDHHRLTIDQRLILFQRICELLSFAHFNLITHRDIKPDNILVTEQGEVKLLDFGIAGLQDPNMETLKTTKLIFTPQYASPEQFMGHSITTATDIYSMGVLLFQMIVGHLPYDSTHQDSPFVFGKMVCEHPPLTPTEVLKKVSPKGLEQIAHNRSSAVGKMNAVFQSDLFYIIRKCLRKEAFDRYHSVPDLKKDIQNYVEHREVSARKGSLAYTFRTFFKRNLLVSSMGILFLVILAGMSIFQYITIKTERDLALKEWKKAEQTSHFLKKLFEQTNPNFTQKGDMGAKDVLRNGLLAIESELNDVPEVKLALYLQIGGIFRRLDGFEEANSALNQAEKLAILLKDEESLSDVIHEKGMVFMGQKKYPEAEAVFNKVLSFPTMDQEDITDVKIALGNALSQQGKYGEAEQILLEITLPEGEHQKNYLRKIAYESALGGLYFHLRDHQQSYQHFSAAVVSASDHGMYQTLENAAIISNLAAIDLRSQKYYHALTGTMEAMSIKRAILPEGHLQLAKSYTNLAAILTSIGEHLHAQEYLLRGIMIKEKELGPDSGELQNDYLSLGYTFKYQGDLSLSQWALSRAESIQEHALGPFHPSRISMDIGLFQLFREMGKEDWAGEVITCALDLGEHLYGSDSLQNAQTHFHLGNFKASQKDCVSAVYHLEKCIGLLKQQPERFNARIEMIDGVLQEVRDTCG